MGAGGGSRRWEQEVGAGGGSRRWEQEVGAGGGSRRWEIYFHNSLGQNKVAHVDHENAVLSGQQQQQNVPAGSDVIN